MRQLFLILSTNIILLSCSTKKNADIMVGNDKDDHGCIGSAGYQWSQTKKTCIRPFEQGTKLNAVSSSSTLAAYILVKGDVIEVFAAEIKGSLILKKIGTNEWKNKNWEINKINKIYYLDKDGKTLYKGK